MVFRIVIIILLLVCRHFNHITIKCKSTNEWCQQHEQADERCLGSNVVMRTEHFMAKYCIISWSKTFPKTWSILLFFPQVLDLSTEGKEEVFYGPTLPFASNGIATCFLPAPYFTCPNLQTLQVPHHKIGAIWFTGGSDIRNLEPRRKDQPLFKCSEFAAVTWS